MGRLPRVWSHPGAGVDILNRTAQGRYLMKPGPRLNAIVVGALAKAREKHRVEIYCGAFMSTHFHLYLSAESIRAQADFMRDFTRKLSLEIGILYDWPGSTFPQRYHAAEVSDEPEAQIARLRYHLSNGCKEGLCDSPLEWPGVPFAEALISGEPLQGIWIDRTAYYRALHRGQKVTLDDFTEQLELPLTPLPCWKHLDTESRRRRVLEIVGEIERETAAQHAENDTSSVGPGAVTSGDPHYRPRNPEKSPQPRIHAFRKKVRMAVREALSLVIAAYLDAAERLRAGDSSARFPQNSFPPRLPFVEPDWIPGRPDLLVPD